MRQPTLYALLILLAFLLLVFIAHILHKKFQSPVDTSRKFLHIGGGILALFMPDLLPTHWWALGLCLLAFLLLLITYLLKYLPGIHQTKRSSVGSIIFPVPVYICFLCAEVWNNRVVFYLPILLLSFADPIAEWGGKKWGHLTVGLFKNQKTLAGSICFGITALMICLIIGIMYHLSTVQFILSCTLVTLVSTVSELLSLKGWDNLTVPLFSMIVLLLIFY